MISGIPFEGPIGSVRIAYSTDGEWIPHPTYAEAEASVFELVVAGRQLDRRRRRDHDGRSRWHREELLVLRRGRPQGRRGSARRRARGVQGVDQGVHRPAAPARRQRDRHPRSDRPARVHAAVSTTATTCSMPSSASATDEARHGDHDLGQGRPQRRHRRGHRPTSLAELAGTTDAPGEFAGREKEIKEAVRSLTKKLVRTRIVDEGVRIDGRGPTDLRPVSAEVGVLPRPTAPVCSSAVRRRCSTSARWPCRA